MSTEENKTLVRRLFDEFINENRMSVADEIFAADHQYHDPSSPQIGPGPEGQKQLIGTYLTIFPDLHHTVEEQIAEGDKVTTRWTATGTQHGELPGLPPTGKTAEVMGIWIHRLAAGKIVESWNVWDMFGMLQQLGAIPTAEQPSP